MKTLMQELKPQLEAQGFAVFYKEALKEDEIDQLIVPVAKEDGSAVNIELNTISDPEGLYPQHELIQVFMSIPVEVPQEKQAFISELISQINMQMNLGAFHLHSAGIIFFKYTLICEKEKKEGLAQTLMDAMDIANHIFQSFEAVIVESIGAD